MSVAVSGRTAFLAKPSGSRAIAALLMLALAGGWTLGQRGEAHDGARDDETSAPHHISAAPGDDGKFANRIAGAAQKVASIYPLPYPVLTYAPSFSGAYVAPPAPVAAPKAAAAIAAKTHVDHIALVRPPRRPLAHAQPQSARIATLAPSLHRSNARRAQDEGFLRYATFAALSAKASSIGENVGDTFRSLGQAIAKPLKLVGL
ncbi:MAG: hypothetical protein KGL46_05775 [Hyphomicrobiales bacterium]|nr:hypothetical protein [Hyphomicrobiales bacterium]